MTYTNGWLRVNRNEEINQAYGPMIRKQPAERQEAATEGQWLEMCIFPSAAAGEQALK